MIPDNLMKYGNPRECTTDSGLVFRCPHCRSYHVFWDYGYNPRERYCLSCGWRENPPPDMFIINKPARGIQDNGRTLNIGVHHKAREDREIAENMRDYWKHLNNGAE